MAFDLEWIQFQRKDGKPGRFICVPGPEYTPLNKCELCGLVSTPKKVHCRNDIYGWNFKSKNEYATKSKSILCMGCWNKVRVLVRRQDGAEAMQKFINKLLRSLKNECKQGDTNNG